MAQIDTVPVAGQHRGKGAFTGGGNAMHRRPMIAAAAMLWLGLGAAIPAPPPPPKVGDIAPPFEIRLIDGTRIRSQELAGQVVVLNYWATWCAPCKVELPLLDRYYSMRRDAGLRVFAITTEDSLPASRLKQLFSVMHIPAVRSLRGKYGTLGAVPTNYIIDRAGRVRYAKAAALELEDLNTLLVPLLREPAPAS
ncbi:TlpA family protein disulfide reductase [Sphingomonas sp. 37zxx]|uniref:TlpA family protein disulfide reductase n=1 Tax=Sphingomonas sp. 37zxx TaxID=1550073 RepID=UPI003FA68D19